MSDTHTYLVHTMAQKSAVLDHMEKANATTAKCKLCRKELSITGGQTSGLKRHLEMQYAIDAKVKVSDDRQPKMASFLSGSHSVSATRVEKINGLVRNLMLSISVVDVPAFVKFILYKSVFCTGIL